MSFNAAYIHDALAVQFFAPYIWLELDKTSGIIPGSSSDQLELKFRSAELDSGTYNATVVINSNDPDEGIYDSLNNDGELLLELLIRL